MVGSLSPLSLSPSLSPSFSPTSPQYSQHFKKTSYPHSPPTKLPTPPPRNQSLNPPNYISSPTSPAIMHSFLDNQKLLKLQNNTEIIIQKPFSLKSEPAFHPVRKNISTFINPSSTKQDTSRPQTMVSKPIFYKLTSAGYELPSYIPAITQTQSFDNTKKYKNEKNITDLDYLLFKASIPASYSDNIAKTTLQQKKLQQHNMNYLLQKQLQQQQLKLKQQPPNVTSSLPSSSSSLSSSFLSAPPVIKDSKCLLKSITIHKENLPLGKILVFEMYYEK